MNIPTYMNFALTDFIFVREFYWNFFITNEDTFLYKASK